MLCSSHWSFLLFFLERLFSRTHIKAPVLVSDTPLRFSCRDSFDATDLYLWLMGYHARFSTPQNVSRGTLFATGAIRSELLQDLLQSRSPDRFGQKFCQRVVSPRSIKSRELKHVQTAFLRKEEGELTVHTSFEACVAVRFMVKSCQCHDWCFEP